MIEVENLSKRYGNKARGGRLEFRGATRNCHRIPRPERFREIHHHADDRRARSSPPPGGSPSTAVTTGSAAAPMAELGVLLEAKAVHTGRSARNHLLALAQTNGIRTRRVDEVIDIVGLREVAGKAGRRVLPRHGSTPRRGIRAAGQPADRGPGRTGQRPGSRRGPVDAHHAQGPGRRGPHRVRVLPSDERNGPDRNTSGRHWPWPTDRRHHGRRSSSPAPRITPSPSAPQKRLACGSFCWARTSPSPPTSADPMCCGSTD